MNREWLHKWCEEQVFYHQLFHSILLSEFPSLAFSTDYCLFSLPIPFMIEEESDNHDIIYEQLLPLGEFILSGVGHSFHSKDVLQFRMV